MVRWIRQGYSREVFLIGRYAVKIPTWRYGWRYFFEGAIANLIERSWHRVSPDPRLCPIVFSSRTGLIVVMPRCEPVSENQKINYEAFEGLPSDNKPDNFGWLNGKIVKLDYGSR